MLIELFGKNHGCFRDDFRLSLLAADIDPDKRRGIVYVPVEGQDPLRLLRAIAIYGPNASGKSTLLRAAAALQYFLTLSPMLASDEPLHPYEPFKLDESSDEASVLGIAAVIDGRVIEYQITFNQHQFITEKLSDTTDDEPRVLLDRNDADVEGEWAAQPQFQLLKPFRPNALLLSLADRLAPGIAGNIGQRLARLLSLNSTEMTLSHRRGQAAAHRAMKKDRFRDWLATRLRMADLGVADLEVILRRETVLRGPASRKMDSELDAKAETVERAELRLLHHARDGRPIALSYQSESRGTRQLVDLAPLFFDLIDGKNKPHAVFHDEIDTSLHPELLRGMIDHFNREVPEDSLAGQLIFTTHETSLIDAEAKEAVLRRDQVYFTEKQADGSARLYSLAEFKERNVVNLRKRYLEGRYGAIPSVGPFEP